MERLLLNGIWQYGYERRYTRTGQVPGLVSDPKKINKDVLWYKKEITLPEGNWTHGSLILKGARFCPKVYVNGSLVAEDEGGMGPTYHLLQTDQVKPGAEMALEVALSPLSHVSLTDASRIPDADRWRSNIASCLWDDVVLKCHGDAYIKRFVPNGNYGDDRGEVTWELGYVDELEDESLNSYQMKVSVLDVVGKVITEETVGAMDGKVAIPLEGKCLPWSPEEPNCYTILLTLTKNGVVQDEERSNFGLKDFQVDGVGFLLNNKPVKLRAGTIVWHRFVRDPEGETIGFDIAWFEEHVIKVLKDMGANTLRFHLGMPPEAIYNLCDRYGLLVQAEWSFFHDMKGSEESLVHQWRHWIDLCMHHPSTALIHGWNETEDDVLQPALRAVERLREEYPPLVISHIDVIHIHKYWWSLFENVGLYYDDAEEFDRPIMVDEFGGNYLDGNGDMGSYPTVEESFLRFLGRGHTKETRLQLQKDANAKIAEYWRRIGAAGYSPFCILGSPEDGSHHYMGPLKEGKLKPIWEALPTVYSSRSCSVELWDHHFEPGQVVEVPLHLFNDTKERALLEARIQIKATAEPSKILREVTIASDVEAYGHEVKTISLTMPSMEGQWVIHTILDNPTQDVTYPVQSEWFITTHKVKVPETLLHKRIGVPNDENELREYLISLGLEVHDETTDQLDMIVGGKATWHKLQSQEAMREAYDRWLLEGCHVVLLEVGPDQLYLPGHTEALAGIYKPSAYEEKSVELFSGMQVNFKQVPEPESCIQKPDQGEGMLWQHLSEDALWLCNGLRGGLIVPTWDMHLSGLGKEDLIKQWVSRGADQGMIQEEGYMAYELAGYYAFCKGENEEVAHTLRERVRFLVEDAPALKVSIDTEAPITKIAVAEAIGAIEGNEEIKSIEGLASCGKSLARTPVVKVTIGEHNAHLILSQLITGGRLQEGYGTSGLYGIRKDCIVGQVVLNILENACY